MPASINDVSDKLTQQVLITRSLADWQPILAAECQVYQFENGAFLAKHFSQIHYTICDGDTATSIIIDNLHALLRNKYFHPLTDEALDRINQIIKAFTTNLKATLLSVAYYIRSNVKPKKNKIYIKNLPLGCIAFTNGVFDFAHNKWLFKYSSTELATGLELVEYPLEYIVRWYFDFDFEPLDLNVNDFELKDFQQALLELDTTNRNLCFELVHNMSFDEHNDFDINRFEHLCEIMGYLCCSEVVEQFCIIFGTGQNGKDSLFRGCFTSHVIPTIATLSLDEILDSPFSTGTLEKACHNLNLELSPKTYNDVAKLKALTGGDEVNIERKNVQSHTGVINCKYLFAGNVQDDIKFTDTSNGFLRRVNVFNVHYVWDAQKHFMSRGKYFDTTFTLGDLKFDIANTIIFIYLAMFGMKVATNGFKTDFKFTHNEWSSQYADIDTDLVKAVEAIKPQDLLTFAKSSKARLLGFDKALYSSNRIKLWREHYPRDWFYIPDQETANKVLDPDTRNVIFSSAIDFINSEYDAKTYEDPDDPDIMTTMSLAEQVLENVSEFYIKSSYLQDLLGMLRTPVRNFNTSIKRAFGQTSCERVVDNQPYYRCTFTKGNHLSIIK